MPDEKSTFGCVLIAVSSYLINNQVCRGMKQHALGIGIAFQGLLRVVKCSVLRHIYCHLKDYALH